MGDFNEKIGNNIRSARKNWKLSQEQLAEMSGLSTNHISKIERGLCAVKLQTIVVICETLDISLEKIVYGKSKDLEYKSEGEFGEANIIKLAVELRKLLDIIEGSKSRKAEKKK